MKPHVVKFFQFLEAKEGKTVSLKTKLLNPDKFKFTKEELDVDGNLYLSNSKIQSLPNGLKVGGWMNLSYSKIQLLPNDLKVGGDLDLYNTPIQTLPNGLKVGGYLDLRNTPLAKTYNKDEIRSMIEANGGYVNGSIYV